MCELSCFQVSLRSRHFARIFSISRNPSVSILFVDKARGELFSFNAFASSASAATISIDCGVVGWVARTGRYENLTHAANEDVRFDAAADSCDGMCVWFMVFCGACVYESDRISELHSNFQREPHLFHQLRARVPFAGLSID